MTSGRAPWNARNVLASPWAPLGIAVILRSLFLWAGWGGFFAGDEASYERLGDLWRVEGSYVGAWPPALPWLISVAGSWLGHERGLLALRVLLVLASGWSCYWLMALARRLARRDVARVAGWLYAVHLPLVPTSHLLLSEGPQVACVLPALVLLWDAARARGWGAVRRATLAGACLGLAGLFRESVVLVLPGLVVWLVLRTGRGRGALLAGYALLGLLLISAPWAARNLRVTGRLAWFGHSGGGFVAAGWNGHHAEFDVEDLSPHEVVPPFGGARAAWLRGAPEPWSAPHSGAHGYRSAENVRRGLRFVAREPGWILRTRVLHLGRAWSPLSDLVRYLRTRSYGGPLDGPPLRGVVGTLALAQSAALLIVACCGWNRLGTRRGGRGLLLAVVLAYGASSLVLAMTRYRVLLDTLLLVPAAACLARGRAGPRVPLGLAALAVAWTIELPWIVASLQSLWGRPA